MNALQNAKPSIESVKSVVNPDPWLPAPPSEPGSSPACWSQIGTWGKRTCAELPGHGHCRNCPTYTAAASRMLEGPVPDGYLEESTQHFAAAESELPRDIYSAVVFRVQAEWFA